MSRELCVSQGRSGAVRELGFWSTSCSCVLMVMTFVVQKVVSLDSVYVQVIAWVLCPGPASRESQAFSQYGRQGAIVVLHLSGNGLHVSCVSCTRASRIKIVRSPTRLGGFHFILFQLAPWRGETMLAIDSDWGAECLVLPCLGVDTSSVCGDPVTPYYTNQAPTWRTSTPCTSSVTFSCHNLHINVDPAVRHLVYVFRC